MGLGPEDNKKVIPTKEELGPLVEYVNWKAPYRLPRTMDSIKSQRSLLIIGIVFMVLFALMREFLIIFMIAGAFLATYALSNTAPEVVTYKITSHGVDIGEDHFYWAELVNFYFDKMQGVELLVISTTRIFPSRIFIHFEGVDRSKLKDAVSNRLTFLEVAPVSFLDKIYDFFASKFGSSKEDKS